MTLLYFSPVCWDSYPQRPHYLVRHFLRRGGRRVVWINPYPTRLPRLTDFRRPPSASGVALDRPAGLEVISLRALPFEPIAAGRWLNQTVLWAALARRVRPLLGGERIVIGIGRPSSLAAAALSALRAEWSFYDAMDDFPEFYHGWSKQSVQRCEQRIVQAVDVVVAASSTLWVKFEAAGSRRRLIHNAFEMSPLPPLPAASERRPVFGYLGCVSAWFDWPIVMRLAAAMPDAAVHVVGPCAAGPPRCLPPNVTLFPECSAGAAIAHLQRFDVGLIPFQRTALTAAVDPIKYYGYRAMGLPVLSTAFGEMTRRGVADRTFLIGHDAGFLETARATLEVGPPAAAALQAFRRAHAWERRFDEARLFEHVG